MSTFESSIDAISKYGSTSTLTENDVLKVQAWLSDCPSPSNNLSIDPEMFVGKEDVSQNVPSTSIGIKTEDDLEREKWPFKTREMLEKDARACMDWLTNMSECANGQMALLRDRPFVTVDKMPTPSWVNTSFIADIMSTTNKVSNKRVPSDHDDQRDLMEIVKTNERKIDCVVMLLSDILQRHKRKDEKRKDELEEIHLNKMRYFEEYNKDLYNKRVRISEKEELLDAAISHVKRKRFRLIAKCRGKCIGRGRFRGSVRAKRNYIIQSTMNSNVKPKVTLEKDWPEKTLADLNNDVLSGKDWLQILTEGANGESKARGGPFVNVEDISATAWVNTNMACKVIRNSKKGRRHKKAREDRRSIYDIVKTIEKKVDVSLMLHVEDRKNLKICGKARTKAMIERDRQLDARELELDAREKRLNEKEYELNLREYELIELKDMFDEHEERIKNLENDENHFKPKRSLNLAVSNRGRGSGK